MNIDISLYEAAVIPAIIFLTWIIKGLGVPNRFLPVICLVLGLVAGVVFVGQDSQGVLTGILIAAAAIGFHSGTKNLLPSAEEEKNK